jgi:predicted TIM-barrel fold metal-dependent hydrolase
VSKLTSASIREGLDHPIIDADAHAVEATPVLLDYLADVAGAAMVDRYRSAPVKRQFLLDPADPYWTKDSGSWVWPTRNTLDRATATLPSLYAQRLDEFGIDFALVYPSEGLFANQLPDDELRVACCRAYNRYIADSYRPFADRMTPAAVIPMHNPDEAIAELEYAVRTLGLKVVVLRSHITRPPRDGSGPPRLDLLALESDYDYDPVWAKCVELGVAATFHSSAIYGSRAQLSNYSYNHIGVLGAGGEAICKALFMGGVTHRVPDLNFAFLEGGVGWAVSLYADLIGHWQRRNGERISDFDPANLDTDLFMQLVDQYGDERTRAHEATLREMFGRPQPAVDNPDNFAAVPMQHASDIVELFVDRFWFGCEADDPVTVHAFDRRANPFGAALRAVFGSDNGHWDVPDMAQVVAEAWELVEHNVMSRDDFRSFMFANPVRLHAGMNPEFFSGTRIEQAVRAELVGSR